MGFYRDVLGLPQVEAGLPSMVFVFGVCQLWIDPVPGLSQAETWLEVVTDDATAAAERLQAAGVVRCDEIEPLSEGFDAFWISSPARIIHLVCLEQESM